MTNDPRTTDEIYQSLRSSLLNQITKLRNFSENSFNYVWARGVSEQVRKLEVQALVAQLAGWIEYSGADVTQGDLETLGVSDSIDPEDINEHMSDEYLNELVKLVGVSRFQGSKATGTVTFRTQDPQTTIPKGTAVSTAPDSSGETLEFITTEEAKTSDGETQVSDVLIEATDVGTEYNLPANSIVRLPSPPVGVTGVSNPSEITGGEGKESNEELRERAKNAVESASNGGTVAGIKGYIRQNVDQVEQNDIVVEEFVDATPPEVDVVVNGGSRAELLDAIEFSRPAGIRHNLARPQRVDLGWDVVLRGSSIDTTDVSNTIENFILELGIGETFFEDVFIRDILNTDDDIVNIRSLDGYYQRIENEQFTYQSGQSDYTLDYTYDTNGTITVKTDDGTSYTKGTDYEIQDQTGDGWGETLVWIGSTPSDGEQFSVDYDVTVPGTTAENDWYYTDLVRDEFFIWQEPRSETITYQSGTSLYEISYVPFDSSSSITDASGNTYAEGTDYEIVDNTGDGFKQTIDWSIGGGTPDDNEDFTIDYNQKVYESEYSIESTTTDQIRDGDGDTYSKGTDYEIVDYDGDGENDAVQWLTNPSTIGDTDEFYLTYTTNGDIQTELREKMLPGTIDVSVV